MSSMSSWPRPAVRESFAAFRTQLELVSFRRAGRLWSVVWLSVLLWLPSASAPAADEGFTVALVRDGASVRGDELEALFRDELTVLTERELEVDFLVLKADWTSDGILSTFDRAYSDPEVDLVLVVGVAASQIAALRQEFPKPTFLPVIFDAPLLGLPREGLGSGRPNLNYLSDDVDFGVNLRNFLDIVRFERLALLVDGLALEAAAKVADAATAVARDQGVELVPVPYLDPGADLVALIPDGVDAVMFGGLGRLDENARVALAAGLIERDLPSFSLTGDSMVRHGMLASDASESDWQRMARRTALNMQAVMLGEEAGDQPVEFRGKHRLYLNIQTAQALDVWPSYSILVEAELIGDDPGQGGLGWGLEQVAHEAVRINRDLLVQRLATDAGAEDVRLAKANLLPQISAQLQVTQLDGSSSSVETGFSAQRSSTGAVVVEQVLWSEPRFAGLDIQRQLQLSREAELESFRLDVVQLATVAFLNILRAETQARVQRDNLERTRSSLELARDRVRVGSSSAADLYRWERELATAQQSSINAYTERVRARENLNRILHRPLDEPFHAVPPGLEDPYFFLIAEGRLLDVIDNPKAFRLLTNLHVREGLERSPELAALRAVLAAKRRERESNRRAYFSPSVILQGRLSQVLEEDRKVGMSLEGENDWSLGLVASLPLFSGGSRKAKLTQADLELQQLAAQLESLSEKIEQEIRSNAHLTNASYNNISLAQQAATAADKNLKLITESYSEGVVSILELLDAQSAALQSNEAAANASYNFLIDLMNAQRAIGRFDFFMLEEDRRSTLDELERILASEGQIHE